MAVQSRELASPQYPMNLSPAGLRGKALLQENLVLIQQRLKQVSRHSGLPAQEVEEFCSWALLKLIEDDYRVLGRWEERSSFSTYITIVLVNLMRDYRIHVWGKWRPSTAARREGSGAVLLERLWLRDGLSLDQAIEQAEQRLSLSRAELEQIAAKLPQRTERLRVGEGELLQIPVDGRVEARIEGREHALVATRIRELLPCFIRSLPAEDRRLLELHYREGLSLAKISRLQGRPQRVLYSSRARCLKKLRRDLERAGLSADEVLGLLGWDPHGAPVSMLRRMDIERNRLRGKGVG